MLKTNVRGPHADTHLTDHLKTSTPLPKGRFTLRPEASEIWASDGLSSFV